MTLNELKAYRVALRDKLTELDRISPTCRHCEHYTAPACAKFGAAPPEDFRATPEACADWTYDQVPF